MKIAFIDGNSNGLNEESNYTDAKYSVSYKFKDQKDLDLFLCLFPKYCKVISRGCNNDISGNGGYEFGANVDLSSPTSKVTGEVNETANKRIVKIKSILSQLQGA